MSVCVWLERAKYPNKEDERGMEEGCEGITTRHHLSGTRKLFKENTYQTTGRN